jgi:hypothetical protein
VFLRTVTSAEIELNTRVGYFFYTERAGTVHTEPPIVRSVWKLSAAEVGNISVGESIYENISKLLLLRLFYSKTMPGFYKNFSFKK